LNGVWELLADLQIVDEAHCPVCHPPEAGAGK